MTITLPPGTCDPNDAKCIKDVLKEVDKNNPVLHPLTAARDAWLGSIADGVVNAVKPLIQGIVNWGLYQPSIRLQGDCRKGANGKVVACSGCTVKQAKPDKNGHVACQDVTGALRMQGVCAGVGLIIAMFMMMFQGLRTVVQRKGSPIMEGLGGLFVAALVSAVGISLLDGLLIASDDLTTTFLNTGMDDKAVAGVGTALAAMASSNPMAAIMLGALVYLVALIQMVLLWLRQAAIPLLAVMLPIAAAGQAGGPQARQWLPKTITGLFVVVVYKPSEGLIFGVGFSEVGYGTTDGAVIRGLVTITLGIIAMPVLMRVLAPLIGTSMGGGGGGLLSALNLGLAAKGAMSGGGGGGGGGSSPSEQEQFMQAHGPDQSEGDTPPKNDEQAPPQDSQDAQTTTPGQGDGAVGADVAEKAGDVKDKAASITPQTAAVNEAVNEVKDKADETAATIGEAPNNVEGTDPVSPGGSGGFDIKAPEAPKPGGTQGGGSGGSGTPPNLKGA
ncbi:MAG: hypothetical protein ACRDP6_32485 [Actinoallomurus sp.]